MWATIEPWRHPGGPPASDRAAQAGHHRPGRDSRRRRGTVHHTRLCQHVHPSHRRGRRYPAGLALPLLQDQRRAALCAAHQTVTPTLSFLAGVRRHRPGAARGRAPARPGRSSTAPAADVAWNLGALYLLPELREARSGAVLDRTRAAAAGLFGPEQGDPRRDRRRRGWPPICRSGWSSPSSTCGRGNRGRTNRTAPPRRRRVPPGAGGDRRGAALRCGPAPANR